MADHSSVKYLETSEPMLRSGAVTESREANHFVFSWTCPRCKKKSTNRKSVIGVPGDLAKARKRHRAGTVLEAARDKYPIVLYCECNMAHEGRGDDDHPGCGHAFSYLPKGS